jgi:hypothetical protein
VSRGALTGRYRARVAENEDPLGLGRLQLRCADVPGLAAGWAVPAVPYAGKGVGFYVIPPKEASVWLEFEGGDPACPVWSGCFWATGEVPLGPAHPVKKVWKTASGTLSVDDTEKTGGMLLKMDGPAASESMSVAIGPDSIVLSCPQGTVTMTRSSIELTVPQAVVTLDAGTIKLTVPGSTVTITAEAVKAENGAGSSIVTANSAKLAVGPASVALSPESVEASMPASSVQLTAGSVSVKGAAVSVTGETSVTGATTIAPSLRVTGTATVMGAFSAEGPTAAISAPEVTISALATVFNGSVEVNGPLLVGGAPVMLIPV